MFLENITSMDLHNYIKNNFPDSQIDKSVEVFTNVNNESLSLRQGAGIYINTKPVLIRMEGSDVLDFIHRISTNSTKELKPFEKINTLFLNEKGRFIDRVVLLNLEKYFLLNGYSNNGWLLNWVTKYIITEDIKTSDISGQYASISIIGPQAASFLTVILGDELKTIDDKKVLSTTVDDFSFIVYLYNESKRLKYYNILIEQNRLVDFVEYLMSNKSVFDVNPVGEKAFEIFRIEMGIPRENEINKNYNPHEVGLINEISFTKGCYIGQEVIARLDTYDKVQRGLYGITLDEIVDSTEQIIIRDLQNEEVGVVTSIANSSEHKKQIGLALVKKKRIEDADSFHVIVNDKKLKLELVELPFSK